VSPTRLGFPTCDWIKSALCVFPRGPFPWALSRPVLWLSLGVEFASGSLLLLVVFVPFVTWLAPELSVETLGHCPRVVVDDEDVDGLRFLPLVLGAGTTPIPGDTCCTMLYWVCVSVCDVCAKGELTDVWEGWEEVVDDWDDWEMGLFLLGLCTFSKGPEAVLIHVSQWQCSIPNLASDALRRVGGI